MANKHARIVLPALGLLALAACRGPAPDLAPPAAGSEAELTPCPPSPNCVSSMAPATDATHYAPPLTFAGSATAARTALLATIEDMRRTEIVAASDRYVHATFASALFRFVDDVTALIRPAEGVVHLRSASRVGYSDLGANRRRFEAIREGFRERMR